MRATITTRCPDTATAKSIVLGLKADNRAAPKPLSITSKTRATRVISTITGAQDIESLLTTLDDLLVCLITVDTLMSSPKWRRPKTIVKH